MIDTKTHLRILVFRCVNCGRDEAYSKNSFEGRPDEDEIRARIYQAICASCGWRGAVCGFSIKRSVESNVETSNLQQAAKSAHA